MLTSKPPHFQQNRAKMLEDIVTKPIDLKGNFSVEAKSLLTGLLSKDPQKRIGSGEGDASEIKSHPWFSGIEWQKLESKELYPPYKPMVTGPEDTRNIDKMFTNEPPKDTPMLDNGLQMEHFDKFTYQRSIKQ